MGFLNLFFGFRGRLARGPFTMAFPLAFATGLVIAYATYAGIGALAGLLNPFGLNAGLVVIAIWWAAFVLTTWALLAVLVKRLHDRDRAGWWAVWGIVPLAVVILLNWTPLLEGSRALAWIASLPLPLYALRALFIIKSSAILFILLIEALTLEGAAAPNRFGAAPGSTARHA